MKEVFISYVSENADIVNRFRQELESRGIEVWLDRDAIDPGARWKRDIRQAIHQGTFFIACFSAEYSSREQTYMNEELTIAIEVLREFHADRIWFIPVKLNECEIPDTDIGRNETLRDLQSVALYEDWEREIQRIIKVIRREFSADSEVSLSFVEELQYQADLTSDNSENERQEVSLSFVEELQYQADLTSDNSENERQAESVFQQGNHLMMSGQLDMAIDAYLNAIAVNPHHARVYHYLAFAYERKGEFDKAIANYSVVINLEQELVADAYNNRGNVHLQKNEVDKAVSDFGQAIDLKEDHAEAYCNRGWAYFKKGQIGKATTDCNKAIDLDLNFAGAYYLRGIIYVRENRQNHAFNDFDKAISLKPDFAEAYYNRGVSYLRRHEFDHALSDFDRATELKPDFTEAVRARALAHQRLQEQTQP